MKINECQRLNSTFFFFFVFLQYFQFFVLSFINYLSFIIRFLFIYFVNLSLKNIANKGHVLHHWYFNYYFITIQFFCVCVCKWIVWKLIGFRMFRKKKTCLILKSLFFFSSLVSEQYSFFWKENKVNGFGAILARICTCYLGVASLEPLFRSCLI